MHWLWRSLYDSAAMLWEVWWALVLGFTLSGVFQVFVSKAQMTREFGRAGFREVALATLFGAASSSCSYAAVATAKTAFKKGAALVPALAFMFASTNLVFELGFVLWLLMGWPFVLAEFIGSFFLIAFMWLLVRLTMPRGLEEEARAHREVAGASAMDHDHSMPAVGTTWREKLGSGHNWTMVADAFLMDWAMLWQEIVIGFLIAGFLAVLVPNDAWRALFLQGHPGPLRLIENSVVGPLVAIASFVCSVGNIPLASILWSGGITFGGVIAFIFADLIVLPIVVIYARYYGWRAAAYITAILFASMVLAGILVDLLFAGLHLIPTGPRPPSAVAHAHFAWDYTTWLDLVAIAVFGLFLSLHARSPHTMHNGAPPGAPGAAHGDHAGPAAHMGHETPAEPEQHTEHQAHTHHAQTGDEVRDHPLTGTDDT